MGLNEDHKSLLKSTLPSIVGVLSGSVAVISYLQSVIFTQNDAREILNKMQALEEKTARIEQIFNDSNNKFSEKIERLENKMENNGITTNKEILGRIRELDNNINRRIDNIYEKLIERKK